MKKRNLHHFVFLFLLGTLASCQFSGTKNAESTELEEAISETKVIEEPVAEHESFLSLEKWQASTDEKNEYFILIYENEAEEGEAIERVTSLKKYHPNAGYLWIPDYASLDGTSSFVLFLDQSNEESKIVASLESTKEEYPTSYAVRVNQSPEKWAAYAANDVRVNGKRISPGKLKKIMTYQTRQAIEDYEEGGGEDWGYFADEVFNYFKKKYPAVAVGGFYYSNLPPEEIKYWEETLDLKSLGFGYIVIDGDKSGFIEHNMPDEVISEAREFFGYK
ncbi:MAG: hypothetical protein WBA61_04815 [Aequorivita sp.]